MILHRMRMAFCLPTFIQLFAAYAASAEPETTVPGVVIDEKGKPLDEYVNIQVFRIEEFHDGKWVRIISLGLMPKYSTDKDGRFALPFHRKDVRLDLWFERLGFAPSFLTGVSAESREVKVVMGPGTPVTGFVSRLVKGRLEPVHGTTVELYLTTGDVGYQQLVNTGPVAAGVKVPDFAGERVPIGFTPCSSSGSSRPR